MSRRRLLKFLLLRAEQTVALTAVLFLLFGLNGFWDFRNNAWAPARLVWQGFSPASETARSALSQQVDMPIALGVWGPLAWLLFLPFGSLNYTAAAGLWVLLNATFLWSLPHLVVPRLSWPKGAVYGALLLLFPPILVMFSLGQISLFLTFILLLSVKSLLGGAAFLAGGLITLGFLKPQLLFFVLPLQGILAYQRGLIKQFGLGILQGAGLQAAGLFLVLPTWPGEYRSILQANPAWFHPNLWSWFSHLLLPPWGMFAWLGCVVVAGWWLLLQAKKAPWKAALWGLALTPPLSPYSWSWDMVLGLPLFIFIAFQLRGRARLWFVTGFVGLCLLVVAQRLMTGLEETFVWVSLALLVLCGAGEYHAAFRGIQPEYCARGAIGRNVGDR